MKTFLAGVAVAAAFASPALAQTAYQYQYPYAQYAPNGRQMYIYPPDNHVHSNNPANDVYDTRGRYVAPIQTRSFGTIWHGTTAGIDPGRHDVRPLAELGAERVNLLIESASRNAATQSKNCALRSQGW